jgi:rhodanese-related sulfurtransferase
MLFAFDVRVASIFIKLRRKMEKRRILLAVSILLLAVLACNFTSPQLEIPVTPLQPQVDSILQSEDDVPRISVQDAKTALDSGQAVIVDVRSTEAYMNRHVTGTVSIPLDRFEININVHSARTKPMDHHLLHLTERTYKRPCGVPHDQ